MDILELHEVQGTDGFGLYNGNYLGVSIAGDYIYALTGGDQNSYMPLSDFPVGIWEYTSASGSAVVKLPTTYLSTTAGSSLDLNVDISSDGINWVQTTSLPSGPNWYALHLARTNDFAFIIGSSSGLWTTDGTTRSTINYPTGDYYTVADSGTRYIAAGYGSYIHSTDGKSWTAAALPVEDYWPCVVHNGAVFCLVSYEGVVLTSTDGLAWISQSGAPNKSYSNGVALENGTIYLFGEATNDIVSSIDNGVSWLIESTGLDNVPSYDPGAKAVGNEVYGIVSYGFSNNVFLTSVLAPASDFWTETHGVTIYKF